MGSGKTTLIRSIRISRELEDILSRDSKSKGISENTLISSILTKYAEWDRYTEKFGFISISQEGFRSILECAEEEELSKIAEQNGARLAKEVMMFWFKTMNVESFLKYVYAYCKYGGVAKYEVQRNGGEYTIIAHHGLGRKWSLYLQHFVSRAMETTLGIIPTIVISDSSLIINFSAI